MSTLQGQVPSLENDNATLKSEVKDVQTKLSKVTYTDPGLNGLPTLKIDDENLQIVSGSAEPTGPSTGLAT